MYAIFHYNQKVIGYKQIEQGEEETFTLPYLLVEELPQAVNDAQDGQFVRYDGEAFTLENSPETIPQKTEEQLKLEQLERENELLKMRAAQLQDDQTFIMEVLITAGIIE